MSQPDTGPDALVGEPVTLINAFTVPPAESERFLRRWQDNARIMAAQPGFIRARMYRALDDARIIDTTAVAATSAFAGGALLTQTVIVPHWRAMDPATFLPHFAIYGPATGATVFPFEIASVLLLAITTYSTAKSHRPGRFAWALATSAMVGTLLLLPIYFVGANLAMLDPTFPPQAVHAELTAWYRWNWVRAGLGLASAALTCIALAASRGENATTPR